MKQKFYITGMTCSACSAFIDKTISNLKGVNNCVVSLVTNTMIVEYDEQFCDNALIINKVRDIGYQASITEPKEIKKEVNNKKIKLIISSMILLILMYVSMGHMFGLPIFECFKQPEENKLYSSFYLGLLQLLLVMPIMALNFGYFTRGFKHLTKGNPNMDSLIAIGSLASLIYGVVTILEAFKGWNNNDLELVRKAYENYYFESAGSILTFVSVGKYLESLSKKKTTEAIRRLVALTPSEVLVCRNNSYETVAIDEVKVGELIMVKPGMQIPLDGKIVEGETSINSASLTGESIPVYRKINDVVLAGTLNLTNVIFIEVIHLVNDSSISKIIKLVEEASNSKMPISRIVDKVARIFVPTVILVAIITGLVWFFIDINQVFNHAVSVLVISCPCALGLATPLAIMVSSGVSATKGILIRNSACLEILKDVKTIVFDKTGTLTKGLMKVKEIKNTNCDYQELIDLIYAIEKYSSHPLASSLCEHLESNIKNNYVFDSITQKPGLGMIMTKGNDQFLVGSPRLLIDNNVPINIEVEDYTKVLIAKNNDILGIVTFEDEIKEQSYELIQSLHLMNIKTVLLSGDNKKVVEALQIKLGIDECYSETLPQDKKDVVDKLKQDGKVLMVGDGINDAVALTTADIGMAIGDGTDIAIDSADIVLIGENLVNIIEAINISKKTIKIIKLNLFWAFFYNAICIPIAAGILVPIGIAITPMIGSLMMSLSSICVVMNSLRLKKIKRSLLKVDIKKENVNMQKKLKIEGMMCKHCQKHVEDALYGVVGVTLVEVSLENKQAIVTLANEVSEDVLKKAVEDAGYDVLEVK